PTSTVTPGSTSSLPTVPSRGDGSSTAAFAVSISQMTWLTATVSPGWTRQLTISASVSPSPTSGRVNSRIVTASPAQRSVDGVEHPVEVGEVVLLALRRRVRGVEPGDPQHRRLQGVERILLDPGGDLGGDRGLRRRLGDHDQVAGAAHRLQHRVEVERGQRAQVDHLEVVAVGL